MGFEIENISLNEVYRIIQQLRDKQVTIPDQGTFDFEAHTQDDFTAYTTVSAVVVALKILLEIVNPKIENGYIQILEQIEEEVVNE